MRGGCGSKGVCRMIIESEVVDFKNLKDINLDF
jgi:hypothetical protein